MSNVIPVKEKLAFSDLFDHNKVKQIAWGETFDKWPRDKQIDYAKALASAMNEAADEMQKDRDRCYDAMILAQKQREEAEQAATLSKNTMIQAVLETNEKVRDLEDEIMILLDRLKAHE